MENPTCAPPARCGAGGAPLSPHSALAPGMRGTRAATRRGPRDRPLRLVERTVDLGDEGRYLVAVAGDSQEIEDETRAFDQALAVTFVMLAAGVRLLTLFQVGVAPPPLKRTPESGAAIRAGVAERLQGTFPVEIEPLARETNAL